MSNVKIDLAIISVFFKKNYKQFIIILNIVSYEKDIVNFIVFVNKLILCHLIACKLFMRANFYVWLNYGFSLQRVNVIGISF